MSISIIENKKRLSEYNQLRYNSALELLDEGRRDIFRIIPFCIHINIKNYPGFVLGAPRGIISYSPPDSISKLYKNALDIKGKFKINPSILEPAENPKIQSILLMGSIGSTAQTKKSDFDFWVCIYEDEFNPEELDLLQLKLHNIEDWLMRDFSMEVHFFITDINKAKANNFGKCDKESAGSSVGKLLKDEFYLTAIHIAGKIPFWWFTPPHIDDSKYERLKELFFKDYPMDARNVIDLGNVYNISKSEFFGAALWQINKAMNYPYKSAIKMSLLETYIDSEEDSILLSDILKRSILKGLDYRELDPYIILIEKILNYHKRKKRVSNLEFINKCFLIKTCARKNDSSKTFKDEAIRHYLKRWRFKDEILKEISNYEGWSVKDLLKLGAELHKYLIGTYTNLSDSLKNGKDHAQKINEIDLTVLGRKLFALYSKKPSKVEFLKKVFKETLVQKYVTFALVLDKHGRRVWALYQGDISKSKGRAAKEFLLKKSKNITELLIWLIYNKLIDHDTRFYLAPNATALSLNDIIELKNELVSFFHDIDISELDNKDLLKKPKKKRIFIAVNVALSAGIRKIEDISIIYYTTWGEMFSEQYGSEGVDRIKEYIYENPPIGLADFFDYYRIYMPKGYAVNKICQTLNSTIKMELKKRSYNYV